MTDEDEMRQFIRDVFNCSDEQHKSEPDRPEHSLHVPREGQSTPPPGFTPDMEASDFVRELFDPSHVPARPPQPPQNTYRTAHL